MHICSKKSMLVVDIPSVNLSELRESEDYKIIENGKSASSWMRYLRHLPEKVQPEFLSNVMKREIENPLVCADTAVVEELKSLLSKKEMFQGLKRILRNCSNIKEKMDQDQKVAAVTNMTIKTVKNLTYRINVSGKIGVTVKEKLFFQQNDLLYVDQDLTDFSSFIRKLGSELSKILDLKENGRLPLQNIFSCKAHEIREMLDDEGLSLNESDAHLQIVLGENVKKEDLLLVDRVPRMSFVSGEFVAIQDESGSYIYAKIVGLVQPKPTNEYDRCYQISFGLHIELELSVIEIFGFKKGIDASINEDEDEICSQIQEYVIGIADSNQHDLLAKIILRYLEQYDPEQFEECSEEFKKTEKIVQFIKELEVELENRDVHVDMAGIRQEAIHCNRVARDNFINIRIDSPVSYPNPDEARRYLNQAKHDLDAIPNDLVKAPSWACYKGHQAAEKAINAVRLYVQGDFDDRHLIRDSADKTGKHDLIDLSRQLENIVGHHTHMRYPRNRMIPAELFNHDDAQRVHGIAEEIVNSAAALIQ